MSKLSLLAVFAHPDDESFGAAGTFAKYTGQGVVISLVTATCGEAGEISDLVQVRPEDLCELREQELRRAMDFVGVKDVEILGYGDGHVPEADDDEIVGRLVQIIRVKKPDVMITFGPDGIYGHPDHVAVHRFATRAAEFAGKVCHFREQLSGGLEPHSPRKLYYNILPKSRVKAMAEEAAKQGMSFQMASDLEKMGVPDDRLTTVIDIRDYFDQKWEAIWSHRSQLPATMPFRTVPKEAVKEFFGFEYFQRVFPPPLPGEPLETDLFAGLS
ncbi:MAG: PIG-L family deacetylase [Chloroflexi bacterium]|nr:PIG-L family deacetylase [Chloroflexota bacterium]